MNATATVQQQVKSIFRSENGVWNPSLSGEVLDLIVERAWSYVRRRTAWLESIGIGQEPSTGSPTSDPDDREAELQWYTTSERGQQWNVAISKLEQRLSGEAGVHLELAGAKVGLTEGEKDLLQICIAAHLDPALGAAFGHLQGTPGRTSVNEAIVRQLMGYANRSIWNPAGGLSVWNLVQAGVGSPGEPTPLFVDPLFVGWLCGGSVVDGRLSGVMKQVERREPLESWPIDELVSILERNREGKARSRVILEGSSGAGRATLQAEAAGRLGVGCLVIDTTEIADDDWTELFLQAQRRALLDSCGLIWRGENLHRRWSSRLTASSIQAIVCEPGQTVATCGDWIDHRVRMPDTSIEERRRLWSLAVPESASWDAADMGRVAEQYSLTPGEISLVGQRGAKSPAEAIELARETMRYRLGDLGTLMSCPFNWSDLVLTDSLGHALRDLTFEARERGRFWERAAARRLFPRGTGLTALFDGSPGTGKTMAAQVIAADLGFDLIRIDMARVQSKYIGETSKHLSLVFSRASRMSSVVLLFDEADALFAKRTEVRDSHDRYANTDTSYLLQLLEEFHGIAILTTNKKSNMDPAFQRRIRYVVEFPKPEVAERRRIWAKVIRGLAGVKTEKRLAPIIDNLAVGMAVSGAQIKNSVLASLFIARRQGEPLARQHLLAGLNRELRKEGRSVGSREWARNAQ